MEWYGNVWCITMDELVRDDRTDADRSEYLAPIVSRNNYKNYNRRGKLQVVRPGKGKGNYALIAYDSLPEELKRRLLLKYPDMATQQSKRVSALAAHFRAAYSRDLKAWSYYLDLLNSGDFKITQERIIELADEYTTNASVLQAVSRLRKDNKLYRKVRGARGASWADMAEAIAFYKDEYGHTLGTSPTRFATWVRKYEAEGYQALVSKKFGNDNTLKMNVRTERLLMELASDKHRPYKKTVWEWYNAFLRGEVQFISPTTGELYNPEEFPDLSERLVASRLQSWLNRSRLSKTHDSDHDYRTRMRPYHKRIKPKYSLSMVSMDDKDFGIKVSWERIEPKRVRGEVKMVKRRIDTSLKAYLCYDVASEAIIGYSFSGEKNADLFESCVKDMYRRLLGWGLGQPHEAQVENHLVSLYKDTMMKAGTLFPEVTFAGAQNSQEKYAERYNEELKYRFEKLMVAAPIGRPHARLEANRTKDRKVSDASNANHKQEVYSFEEAIAVYEQVIEAYNNSPHPKQKQYPGKTRLEVLLSCVHPDIQPINMYQLTRWAGEETRTSVNARGFIRVNYEDYSLSSEQMARLSGGNHEVVAYRWEQDEAEQPDSVLVYQNDVYIGSAERIVPYQVSKLERTSDDMRLLAAQQARVRAHDEMMERLAPEGLVVMGADTARDLEIKPIKVIEAPLEGDVLEDEEDTEDLIAQAAAYAQRGLASL